MERVEVTVECDTVRGRLTRGESNGVDSDASSYGESDSGSMECVVTTESVSPESCAARRALRVVPARERRSRDGYGGGGSGNGSESSGEGTRTGGVGGFGKTMAVVLSPFV